MGVISQGGGLDETNRYIAVYTGYSNTKNQVAWKKDQRGKVIAFTTDEITGLRSKISFPNQTQMNISYYPNSQYIKSISCGAASVEYTYKNTNKLGAIKRSGYSYQLDYNDFGRLSAVKAAENSLISYNYYDSSSMIKSAKYGNGQIVDYTYNSYNKLATVRYNDTAWYSNTYDKKGRLARNWDYANGRRTDIVYDVAGRIETQSIEGR